MTELEKALEQLKLFLNESGYEEAENLMTMSKEELDELFRRFKRDVRKRERAYSPNSDEYKKLNEQRALVEQIEKMLRDREMENSGLMLPGADEEDDADSTELADMEKTDEATEERKSSETSHESYKAEQLRKYKDATDVQTKQEIYREVAKKAESDKEYLCLLAELEEADHKNKDRIARIYDSLIRSGSVSAAWKVTEKNAEGILLPYEMNETYRNIAIEGDCAEAILDKAWSFAKLDFNSNHMHRFEEKKEPFELFEKYLKLRSAISMQNGNDRKVVFYYYRLGTELGYDLLKESVTVPLRELIENEGIYTWCAQCLEGQLYLRAGRYDEAQKLLCNVANRDEEATVILEKLLLSNYMEQRPQEQKDLEVFLEGMLYCEDVIPAVREELFEWYGWRYEFGKNMVCNPSIAYAYYNKAAQIGKWTEDRYKRDKWLKYRGRLLRELNREEQIVFYRNVLEYEFQDGSCITDVYLFLGNLYKEKNVYEKAISYYSEGSSYATDPKVREQCREEYNRCNAWVTKHQVQWEEAEESYNECNSGNVRGKPAGFKRLRELARKGNTYAALRFAQVAEQDEFLRAVMQNDFPTTKEIFSCYKAAAEAGEREAISRMADILEHGQLGQLKDTDAAERWRRRL